MKTTNEELLEEINIDEILRNEFEKKMRDELAKAIYARVVMGAYSLLDCKDNAIKALDRAEIFIEARTEWMAKRGKK